MADNSTLPVNGGGTEVFANDDIGSVKYPRVKATWGPDGTANDTDNAAGKQLPVYSKTRMFAVAAAAAVTRQANVTAYTAGDAVSNNATAGSVTPISFTLSDLNDETLGLDRCRIASTDTGLAGNMLRIYLYQTDPTASSGVTGGDNVAWSTKQGTFIGTMSGTLRAASDGSVGVLTPDEGTRIITAPTSGAKTVFGLLMTPTGFTPSAVSTTITPTLEGTQGRA
jgi:hypothetical protein